MVSETRREEMEALNRLTLIIILLPGIWTLYHKPGDTVPLRPPLALSGFVVIICCCTGLDNAVELSSILGYLGNRVLKSTETISEFFKGVIII